MLELAPEKRIALGQVRRPRHRRDQAPSGASACILLAGCAQQVLRPEINDATIRLLARRGVDVEVAAGAGCCGALVHHMGKEAQAIEQAKAQRRRLVKVDDARRRSTPSSSMRRAAARWSRTTATCCAT